MNHLPIAAALATALVTILTPETVIAIGTPLAFALAFTLPLAVVVGVVVAAGHLVTTLDAPTEN